MPSLNLTKPIITCKAYVVKCFFFTEQINYFQKIYAIVKMKGVPKMSLEDQDYIMRQIQLFAKGIGKFLDIFSIKEILKSEYSIKDEMTDREIESIVYMVRIEEIQAARSLTAEEMSRELGIDPERLTVLLNNEEIAKEVELSRIIEYVEDKQVWL